MGRIKELLEKYFAAVAFTEADEPAAAMQMAGLTPVTFRAGISDAFAAVAFAEANCHETAREFLGMAAPQPDSGFHNFLVNVGLTGTRVWFGTVNFDEPSDFAAALGLSGVRVWYGTAKA
jgi:hypothetical protein